MPVYTYRREDGTTFDYKQSFNDSPLLLDPQTGQKVVRVVQNTGVIFKGSGFYVNDSKSASKSALSSAKKADANSTPSETKADAKTEAKTETKSAVSEAAAD